VITTVHQSGFPVLTVVTDDSLWELSAAADGRYVFHFLVCEEPRPALDGRDARRSTNSICIRGHE
jgi:hypothetical protein